MRTPRTLVVQEEHVEVLEQLVRAGKTENRVAYRARIVLLRGEGLGPSEVAELVEDSFRNTAGKRLIAELDARQEKSA